MMDISVIITTYKRPELLKRALKSVTSQTLNPSEIIVIEDFSDNGKDKWANEKQSEIIYTQNEKNLGLAGSRNVGIHRAKSDWITFLDDDDQWLPERLEEQVQCYKNLKPEEKEKLACIQCGVKKIDVAGKVVGIQLPKNNGNLKESIIKYGASTPSSSFLFKKEALLKVGGFDENLISGIDHDIWMKLAVAGYKTKALKKPLVIIHQEPIETMMSNTEKRIKGITQYVEKWTPTFAEWYGEKKGNKYAKSYYTSVIGKLAGQKLADHQFQQFQTALKSIWKFTDRNLNCLIKAINIVLKIYIVEKVPAVQKYIRKRKKNNQLFT